MGREKLSPTVKVQSINTEEMIELERLLFGALIVLINSGKKFQCKTKLVGASGKGNEIFTESQSTSLPTEYLL